MAAWVTPVGVQRSEWLGYLFLEPEPIGLADGWPVSYEGNRGLPGGPLTRWEEDWLGDGSASQEVFLAMFVLSSPLDSRVELSSRQLGG